MRRRALHNLSIVLFSTSLLTWVGSFFLSELDAVRTVPAAAAENLTEKKTASEPELDSEIFEATAYCVYGITFSGVLVQRGIVAADPEILPIGSVIEVRAGKYSGIYTVMDTGAVIKGKIIDIYMPDYEEAIQFGRQKVQVRVLRHGWNEDPNGVYGYGVAG